MLPYLRRTMHITIRPITSEAEFAALDGIYQSCFGAASVPTDVQRSWWLKYPPGMLGLFVDDEVIGGTSCWPVNDHTFDTLLAGTLREKEITAEDFDVTNPHLYYFSDIAVIGHHRGGKYAWRLMDELLTRTRSRGAVGGEIKILSLAYSAGGAHILQKSGFVKVADAEKMADGQPSYLLQIPATA
jgi:ribosomal protein S18 acetylase RimI-like enzyme